MDNLGAVFPALGVLVVVLVVLAALGLIGWVIWASRRRNKARDAFLTAQGFTRLEPAPEFQQRLERIYRRGPNQRFLLTALYARPNMQGGSFYVFDLLETSGEENTHVASGSVAYISPEMNLPRIHISGRMALEGKVGQWMNDMAEKVVDWATTQIGMTRLDLFDMAEIDERLMVLAADESAALEFLTRERLGRLLWLAQAERLSEIDCDGDCIVVKRVASRGSGGAESELRALLDDARRTLTALS